MHPRRALEFLLMLSLLAVPSAASAQDKVTYQDNVLPVFRNTCLNCHNPDKKKAGLDLSSYVSAMAGSENGKVLEPGDPDGSLLFGSCRGAKSRSCRPRGTRSP